jgi:hypothetical protein
VGHVRLILLLAFATALVALSASAAALAGTYTWSQPSDFSGTQNAVEYGSTDSWSYQGTGTMTFQSGTWSDGLEDSISTTSGPDLTMQAAAGNSTTITWTNPFPSSQTVTVSSTMALTDLCALGSISNPSGTTSATTVSVTLTGGAAGCSASGTISITAPTPSVTLTTPAGGSTFTTGQPEFSGTASTAFDASNTVAVKVFSGTSASGTPAETLTTTQSGGSYAAVPTTLLPNGTYTAQAQQYDPKDTRPQLNQSNPVTFTLDNTSPTLTLSSFGSKPQVTSTPTFSGTAGTRADDSNTVGLAVYRGSSISGSAVEVLTGSVASNARFSIHSAALADGRYTAIVVQYGGGLIGFSTPMTFRIKAHPPDLTMSHPYAGGAIPRSNLYFSGGAGDALGDSPTVSVSLYRGANVNGRALGTRTVNVSGSSWSLRWSKKLKNAIYTVRAVQTDDAGHTAQVTHTFIVVPAPTTVGLFVSLSRGDVGSIPITCLASSGTCSGTVLVVTKRSYRTSSGGPSGRLRVLFAYVHIGAGGTRNVRGSVPGSVAAVLRRRGGVKVKVTTKFSTEGTSSATRSLKLG